MTLIAEVSLSHASVCNPSLILGVQTSDVEMLWEDLRMDFLPAMLPDSLPLLRVRDPALCGCAGRPVGGGHQDAGSGRRSLGLQKQRWHDSAPQSCQSSQSRWAAGKASELKSHTEFSSDADPRLCLLFPGSPVLRSLSRLQRPMWPDPPVLHCTDRGRHFLLRDLAVLQGQAGDKGRERLGRVSSGNRRQFNIYLSISLSGFCP